MEEQPLKESQLEIMVDAALGGHDLGPFELVEDRMTGGYQARCRRCAQTVWVGEDGLIYSLLDDLCTGQTSDL